MLHWDRNNLVFAFVKLYRNFHTKQDWALFFNHFKTMNTGQNNALIEYAKDYAIKELEKYKANLDAELKMIKDKRIQQKRSFDTSNPSDMYGFELVASNKLYAKKLKAVKNFRMDIGVSRGINNNVDLARVKKNKNKNKKIKKNEIKIKIKKMKKNEIK